MAGPRFLAWCWLPRMTSQFQSVPPCTATRPQAASKLARDVPKGDPAAILRSLRKIEGGLRDQSLS